MYFFPQNWEFSSLSHIHSKPLFFFSFLLLCYVGLLRRYLWLSFNLIILLWFLLPFVLMLLFLFSFFYEFVRRLHSLTNPVIGGQFVLRPKYVAGSCAFFPSTDPITRSPFFRFDTSLQKKTHWLEILFLMVWDKNGQPPYPYKDIGYIFFFLCSFWLSFLVVRIWTKKKV